jgi:glycosyltransferase involved in cell wall biosynthesis
LKKEWNSVLSNQISFSIIVPVYNTEKYIEQCINSVLSQRYSNYELILIDDGSTDQSGNICKKYSNKNNNIHYHYKNNGGPSSARNVGLDNATGDYILFLDSDDRMYEELLINLNDIVAKDKYDIYLGSYTNYSEYHNQYDQNNLSYSSDIYIYGTPQDVLHNIFFNNSVFFSIWRYVFKKSLIKQNNIVFDETLYCAEDGDFIINNLLSAKSFGVADIPFCYYSTGRTGSIITTNSLRAIKSLLEFTPKWYLYFHEIYLTTYSDKSLDLIVYFANYFLDTIISSGSLERKDRKKLKNTVKLNSFMLKNVKGNRTSIFICRILGYVNSSYILYNIDRIGSKIIRNIRRLI